MAIKYSKLQIMLMFAAGIGIHSSNATAGLELVSLSDEEMAAEAGQALFNASYLAPSDSSNFMSASNIGFYKLGLEAEVAVNANIKKLQLGCGGTNGAGGCDIDIDNLSLSGNSATREGRVGSDAILQNPFLEFAIKDPNSASTREIAGFRLSAERAVGLLTAGKENSTSANGINSLSGFLRVQSDNSGFIYGKAKTGVRFLDARPNAPYVINGVNTTLNNEVTGKIQVAGLGGAATISIKSVGGGLKIPAMENIPFIRSGIVVNGNRIESLALKATLAVPTIKADFRGVNPADGQVIYHNPTESPVDWVFNTPKEVRATGGGLDAEITGCSGLLCGALPILGLGTGAQLQNAFIKGNISGITADATINQGLGYIHAIPIDSPFYLSLQKEALRWPGSFSGPNPERTNVDGSIDTTIPPTVTDIAQKGWWLSLADPVNLGSVDPTQAIDIAPLFPQIATQISGFINSTPYPTVGVDGLVNAITGAGDINVTLRAPVDLTNSPLSLTLNDLQLNGQGFAPNCYGNLTFC